MSGICGWINWRTSEPEASHLLSEMARRLRLGPDEIAQRHIGPDLGVAVVKGRQPADLYTDDRLWVACCGHLHWGDPGLAGRAATDGAAAVIATCYRDEGPEFLSRLDGPFSVFLADRRRRRTLLAIDRMGIQTLHYGTKDDTLVFGSTAGVVTAHPAAGAEVDPQGVFDYVYFSMIPAPRTIYRGQRKLRPAEYLIQHEGREQKGFYWQLDYHDEGSERFSKLASEFLELLRTVVDRAAPDGDAGAFLSGGTDSSTVSGILRENRGEPIDTYSIGFSVPGYDETDYARTAARHFGTRYHDYYVTPKDVLESIPLVASVYDEPFGNESAVPVYCCSRMARNNGARTLLAGDGGDEIFAGNERYAHEMIFEAYNLMPESLRRSVLEPLLCRPRQFRLIPVRKLQSYVRRARVPLPDRMGNMEYVHEPPIHEAFSPDWIQAIDREEPLDLLREVYFRSRSRSTINRILHMDLKITLADNDLRKVSRMCEAGDVVVRYPLLDTEMVEFSGRVPAKMKLKRLELRYFFKKALKDFLPREVIEKKKHGFGLPFGKWLLEDSSLRELANDSLSSLRQRGIFRPKYIDELRRLHQTSQGHSGYYGAKIWVLMMLEHWYQVHGNRNRSQSL